MNVYRNLSFPAASIKIANEFVVEPSIKILTGVVRVIDKRGSIVFPKSVLKPLAIATLYTELQKPKYAFIIKRGNNAQQSAAGKLLTAAGGDGSLTTGS